MPTESAGEPPVGPAEFLMRRFPGEPGVFDFAKKFPRQAIFLPDSFDRGALSLYREGADNPYPSAATLLTAATNIGVRERGGVAAVLAAAVFELGLRAEPSVGTLSGHIGIEQMSREKYDGSADGKRRIKQLADGLIRLAAEDPPRLHIRVPPKPRDAVPPPH